MEEIVEIVKEKPKKKDAFSKRIHELDFARGILMVLVIMDHLFNLFGKYFTSWAGNTNVGLANAGNFFNSYVNWFPRTIVRYICLALFVFLSGISSAFSKDNWKRACKMVIFWLFLFILSGLLHGIVSGENPVFKIDGLPSTFIALNIIGVIGFSCLLYCPFQGKKWYWTLIAAIVFICIHIFFVCIKDTTLGKNLLPVEPFIYKSENMADFMPLFPYAGIFLLGGLFSEFTYCKHNKESYFKRYNWERPICFLGRHSLIIYITHFLVLVGIFSLIGVFIGK